MDSSGNVYVAGFSSATWGSPVRAFGGGTNDALVAKLNSSGSLVWNTFLGGTGDDKGNGIAVDSSGNVYVAGYQRYDVGLARAGLRHRAGCLRGQAEQQRRLHWNTFLGGNGFGQWQRDRRGRQRQCVRGWVAATRRGARPCGPSPSGTDAFAAKLNSSGTLTWNTFLGAGGTAMAVGSRSTAAATCMWAGKHGHLGLARAAYTSGTDAFAAKLTSSGSLTWNTFLGGSRNG